MKEHEPPEHGGRLRQAAARFGIPLARWLDLSTGINPRAWPVPTLPASAWGRLPEAEDGLESEAARYYGAPDPLPLAGSQAAIQALPAMRAPCRVGVPQVGYREHAYAWRRAGHHVIELADSDPGQWLDEGPGRLDCLVVINPNNPTGHCWPVATLLDWHARLAARGGWLIVDEAFMDVTPAGSLTPYAGRPGLILLRSLGKFFGLAGARVGFLFAEPALRATLNAWLGPWTLTGPSRLMARQAFADTAWQRCARASLALDAARLAALLRDHGLAPTGGTALFQWVLSADAERIDAALAQQGVLARRFDRPASLRFGLPGEEQDWQRLSVALASAVHS
ncbi:threonine-phosphate decarboxylase CobD [uncultured Thiocystis sp.]|uniref:threonine-phosphate decarboxylase CobD n=1 Tax=uncultured Thiocystis sp. TaxID=1202134 RepID=UPI0025EDC549|nr:threonine-phosphate decarboxylase CobD [uncultured Thiocystis sp.]